MRSTYVAVAVAGALIAFPASAWGSCGPFASSPAAELEARADVAFDGVALEGSAADGSLISPARFRVIRYLKGSGREVVKVQTATERHSQATHLITPRPGEVWRIYTRERSGYPLERGSLKTPEKVPLTSQCFGSQRLRNRESDAQSPVAARSEDEPPSPASSSSPPTALLGLLGVALAGIAVAGMFWRRRATGVP